MSASRSVAAQMPPARNPFNPSPCPCESCQRNRRFLSPGGVTYHDFVRGIRPQPQPPRQVPTPAPERNDFDRSYRRGVHQSAAFSVDLLDTCETIEEARVLFRRVEDLAREFREAPSLGGPCLLDDVRVRLTSSRNQAPQRIASPSDVDELDPLRPVDLDDVEPFHPGPPDA